MKKKGKDRTWDFEGRCTECGKPLNLALAVISRSLVVLRLDGVCEEHPGDSVLLWPQRDDIVKTDFDTADGEGICACKSCGYKWLVSNEDWVMGVVQLKGCPKCKSDFVGRVIAT